MEFLIGFGIAIMIGLTGVGGGVITAPVLTLFLGVPPAQAIGTALVFSAVVKAIVAPAYLIRAAGRLPDSGVICWPADCQALFSDRSCSSAERRSAQGPLLAVLGATVVIMALMNLYRASKRERVMPVRDRARWLPWIALPIGAEVGFSSAGAGRWGRWC